MKKLGLKPLEDLRGKLGMGWLFIGLIMAFCVSACSDDDDDTVTPVFPAKQTINCNVGETKELSFDANTNWQLTSSATWCRFVVDGEEEYSLSGNAGNQRITLKVTGEAQQNDGISIAQLTLVMGNGRATIADVVRSAEGYELKLFGENGQEINEIEAGYGDYISFKVKANFRFAATNRPDWIEIAGGSIVGAVNQEITGKVKVLQNGQVEKYPVAAGSQHVITFAAEDGKGFFSFPVVYKGMKPEAIVVTKPSTNAWGWTVSLDGKDFSQQSGGTSGSGSSLSYRYRVPFTIKALNDDYVIVYMEEWKNFSGQTFISPIDPGMEWMHCSGSKGAVTLTVDPIDPYMMVKERTGFVLAFPRAEYELIKNDLEGAIVKDGEIEYKYEQSNLLIAFTQKEVKEVARKEFDIVNATTMEAIESTEYTGQGADYFKGKYDVTKIYEVTKPARSMNINPQYTYVSDFMGGYWDDESPLDSGVLEMVDMTTINVYSEGITQDIFVVFRDSDGNGKMLLIRLTN